MAARVPPRPASSPPSSGPAVAPAVPSRLDEPIDLGQARRLAADHRHEREFGRLRDREAHPEQHRQHKDCRGRVEDGRERRRDRRLRERGGDEDGASVEPVDEPARERRQHDGRRPEREEKPCHHERGTARALKVEGQRHPLPSRE